MDVWTVAQWYGIISLALAGTSYLTLYIPGIELAEEILDERLPLQRGWIGTSLWFILSTLISPWTAIVLLSNNNEDFIEKFAVALADNIIKKEDNE